MIPRPAFPRLLRRAIPALLLVAAVPGLGAQALLPGNLADQRSTATSERNPALGARIDSILARPHLAQAAWGVEVRDAATGRTLYSRNADRPAVPASSLKLVVAAATAHHLEPDHRFRTSLHATGPVRGGVLHGDLVLYGRGDPTLSARYFDRPGAVFEALADSLHARGVHRVEGAVVADESWFEALHLHPDWNQHDLLWWYAAPVSALGFNDNSVDIRVLPGAGVGSPARVSAGPASRAYALENATRTVARGGASTFTVVRGGGAGRLRAVGDVPLGAPARTVHVAVDDAPRWAGIAFRETLEARGIAVAEAGVRVVSAPSVLPADAVVLAEWRSPPLDHAIGPVLLRSQNWFAELLLKTLGREVLGEGSWEAGLAVERTFLSEVVGIPPAAFTLRDGSGLSSRNRISPAALATLLGYIRSAPSQRGVFEALPVSGRSGSMERRLTDLPGRVAAKTGYIRGVDALAGVVTRADGSEAIFVIVSNESREPSARMKAGIDDVVRAIARTARR